MFLIKLLALPLVAAVTLIQWVAIFLTSFSAILFDLLAGIIFMITLAGLLFGVCTGMEALNMINVMLDVARTSLRILGKDLFAQLTK